MKIEHYKNYKNRKRESFRYFISYSFQQGNGSGFGNVEVFRYKRFQNINDVKQWARGYEKEKGFNPNTLVVINFQLF